MAKRTQYKKYDWLKLKTEYLSGDWLTVREFLEAKGIPFDRQYLTSGWATEKKNQQQRALQQAVDKTAQAEVDSILDVRQRQARFSRFAQLKGIERLKQIKPEQISVDDARKLLETGLREERKALGMEGGGNQNLTQINIGGVKTNIDKLVEGLDYEGILGLIAELKRLRSGRTIQQASASGSGQAQDGEIVGLSDVG